MKKPGKGIKATPAGKQNGKKPLTKSGGKKVMGSPGTVQGSK